MKRITTFVALSLALVASSSAKSLPRYDQEILQTGKKLYDQRGRQEWLVGLKKQAPNESAFKRQPEGVWYTGRVQVRRWGADMNAPLEQYGWDTTKGHRWMVMREMVYRDPQTRRLGIAYQGPNALDQYKYGRVRTYSQELVGRASGSSVEDGQKLTLRSRSAKATTQRVASR